MRKYTLNFDPLGVVYQSVWEESLVDTSPVMLPKPIDSVTWSWSYIGNLSFSGVSSASLGIFLDCDISKAYWALDHRFGI